MEDETFLLGAVAYAPKVVDIWEGMQTYFREAGLPLEIVLFLSYEAQVEQLLKGGIDIGWNTNLAHLQLEHHSAGSCRPLAMRDTDLGWTTEFITIDPSISGPQDLRGKKLALGSRDSGHAAILPVHFLAAEGLEEGRDYETIRFNLDVGKHGDTGTSENDVYRAVLDGTAAVGAVGSPFWSNIASEGLNPGDTVRSAWTSPPYNHCMFTARKDLPVELERDFSAALFAMDWDNPLHRPILEAEGLKKWVPPQLEGYESLRQAANHQGFFGS